ncbi:MAG: hypothetical protein JWR08_503 [Enterovirga sp.]|jgi:peptidoglycan hydrolase-like protein with peptidoglycan-binding domain|nr:hypothetical protein [Enterovirga sp.]
MALLSRGSTGPEVRALQARLNEVHKPYPPLKVDGIFGALTEAAVRGFQTRRNLKVDGIVGPKTQAALTAGPGPAPGPDPGPGISLSYVVPGMQHIHQDKAMSCWFASAQMLIQWKRNRTQMSDNHPDPSESPKWSKLYSDDTGIDNPRILAFARDMGFKHVPPMSPRPEAIQGWLVAFGPLWVNGKKHITVIAGIRGDSRDPDVLVFDPAKPAGSGGEWRNLYTWYILDKHSGRDTDVGVEAVFLHIPAISVR